MSRHSAERAWRKLRSLLTGRSRHFRGVSRLRSRPPRARAAGGRVMARQRTQQRAAIASRPGSACHRRRSVRRESSSFFGVPISVDAREAEFPAGQGRVAWRIGAPERCSHRNGTAGVIRCGAEARSRPPLTGGSSAASAFHRRRVIIGNRRCWSEANETSAPRAASLFMRRLLASCFPRCVFLKASCG